MRGFSAADGGGVSSKGGAAVGDPVGARLGDALGVVTVVNVSGGSCGEREGLGCALGATELFVVAGADVTGWGAGARVALVEALSPLLMMTAVAIAPTATTAPRIAVAGRQRSSAGQPVQV